jgi:hypothetical protein
METRRCHHCGGNLGLIIQRYYFRRFCSRQCLHNFKSDLQRELDRRRSNGWFYPHPP